MQGKYEATAQTGVCGGKATAGPSVRAADAEGGECGLERHVNSAPPGLWLAALRRRAAPHVPIRPSQDTTAGGHAARGEPRRGTWASASESGRQATTDALNSWLP